MKRGFSNSKPLKRVTSVQRGRLKCSLHSGTETFNTVNTHRRKGALMYLHPLTDCANTQDHTHIHILVLLLSHCLSSPQRSSTAIRFLGNRPPDFLYQSLTLPGVPRRSSPLAFSVSHPKSSQPSHHSLYLPLCLNLPCMHLDIFASGCISESRSEGKRKRESCQLSVDGQTKMMIEKAGTWKCHFLWLLPYCCLSLRHTLVHTHICIHSDTQMQAQPFHQPLRRIQRFIYHSPNKFSFVLLH